MPDAVGPRAHHLSLRRSAYRRFARADRHPQGLCPPTDARRQDWCSGNSHLLRSLHQLVYLGAGANFVVGVSSRSTNLAVGHQLADKALADDDRLERIADRHFAEVKDGALAAPRHQAFGLRRSERDLFAELCEALFI